MTMVQEIILERMTGMDAELKEYGATPYGMVRGTEKDQKDRYRNLTPHELARLIDELGPDEVNKWLGKHMEGY